MEKRERLEKTLRGEATDRVPVALWRHWPGDDQRAADLAKATLAFQNTYDWDFINITPASTAWVTDYGVQSARADDLSGDRVVVKCPVKRSLQWTELRALDPMRGELGKYFETVNLVEGGLSDDVPMLVTIYSPLTQAAMIAEGNLMLRNMRTHPDRLHSGLNIITESILNFITALRRTNIAGIFYVVDHADFALMSEAEYNTFGVPYDRKILETLPAKWWLNMLHLGAVSPMFELTSTYPVQAINWDCTARVDVDKAWTIYKGALCTGLSQHIHHLTPTIISDAARSIMENTGNRRLILAASGAVPVCTPLSNMRTLRESVESVM